SVETPGGLAGRRPGGRRVDSVTLGVGRGETCEAGTRPRIEGDSQRGREHARPECTDDVDICGGEPFGERLELAQQHSTGSGVGAELAAGALDLAPGQLRVDLEADEQLMVGRDRWRGAGQLEVRLHRDGVDGDGGAIPRLAEVAADLVSVGRN